MIAQCPRCNDEVLLPGGFRPESRVRCPLCREEYLLSDAMRKLPPVLIVVDGVPDESREWAHAGASGAEYVDSYGGGVETAVETELATEEMTAAETVAEAAPRPLVKTSPRRKPKQKSVVMEGVKIVLGGAVGLFVAQLILWWGFHNDSFGIAPSLAKNSITRLLLPEALRKAPTPEAGETSQGGAGASGPTPVAQGQSSGVGFNDKVNWNDVVGGKGDGAKKNKASAPKPSERNNAGNPGGDELVADIDAFGDKSQQKGSDPFDLKLDQPAIPSVPKGPDIVSPSPDNPIDPVPPKVTPPATKPQPTPEPDKPATESPVQGLAVRPAADLTRAIGQVQAAQEKLGAVDRTNRDEVRMAAEALYKSATAMAESATAADAQDADYAASSRSAADFMKKLVADPLQVRMISAFSPTVLDAEPSDSPPGIVLQGVVMAMKTQGEMTIATIKLATKDERVVSVVRKGEFPESFVTDANVVILGVVVHDPASRINGYADDDKVVVYAGLGVVPEKPDAPKE